MTKFILHGGGTSKKVKENNLFWKELFRDAPGHVTYLGVYFARNKDAWQKTFERYNNCIRQLNLTKKINFVLANDDTSTLIEQIENSDVIFFSGGESYIDPFFEGIDLKDLLDEKTITGSSMGTYFLSTYYYRNSTNEIREGSGLLPIKVTCHYNDERRDAVSKLNDYKECLDVHTLRDEQVIVLYN